MILTCSPGWKDLPGAGAPLALDLPGALQYMPGLFMRYGRRLVVLRRADKARHPRDLAYRGTGALPVGVGKIHLDEDIARKHLPGGGPLLAVLDVDDFLAGHLYVGDDGRIELALARSMRIVFSILFS